MSMDPAALAEMAQVDISVVRPFLRGTEGYSEGKITDEIFALKFFVDILGNDSVRDVAVNLGSAGKHDEILATLQLLVNKEDGTQQAGREGEREREREKEEETAKAKKSGGGVFGWFFKSKEPEKEKEKEKEHEKDREKEKKREKERKAKSRSVERHHKHASSKPSGHTDPNSPERSIHAESEAANSDDLHEAISTFEERQPVARHSPQSASIPEERPVAPVRRAPGRGLPFNPQFSELEAQMLGQYNFQSTTNRGVTTQVEGPAQSSARRDDDFDAIFNEFVSKAKAEQQ